MNSSEDKRNYFELGIAFARFSAKPDEDEHKYTHRSVEIHRGNLEQPRFPDINQAKHVAGLTQVIVNYFNDPTES